MRGVPCPLQWMMPPQISLERPRRAARSAGDSFPSSLSTTARLLFDPVSCIGPGELHWGFTAREVFRVPTQGCELPVAQAIASD